MHIKTSYAQFMVSRVFQGIGWGSMEGLVAVSIRDMFFVSPWPLVGFNYADTT